MHPGFFLSFFFFLVIVFYEFLFFIFIKGIFILNGILFKLKVWYDIFNYMVVWRGYVKYFFKNKNKNKNKQVDGLMGDWPLPN